MNALLNNQDISKQLVIIDENDQTNISPKAVQLHQKLQNLTESQSTNLSHISSRNPNYQQNYS